MCVCVRLGDDKALRKGQVLTLLAEQALTRLDFKAAYIHCQELMAAGTRPGGDLVETRWRPGVQLHLHAAQWQQ